MWTIINLSFLSYSYIYIYIIVNIFYFSHFLNKRNDYITRYNLLGIYPFIFAVEPKKKENSIFLPVSSFQNLSTFYTMLLLYCLQYNCIYCCTCRYFFISLSLWTFILISFLPLVSKFRLASFHLVLYFKISPRVFHFIKYFHFLLPPHTQISSLYFL